MLDDGPQLFLSKREQSVVGESPQEAVLYEQIGRLKMELEWLKKKWSVSVEEGKAMIEPNS